MLVLAELAWPCYGGCARKADISVEVVACSISEQFHQWAARGHVKVPTGGQRKSPLR